jgi:hypothetical protein
VDSGRGRGAARVYLLRRDVAEEKLSYRPLSVIDYAEPWTRTTCA